MSKQVNALTTSVGYKIRVVQIRQIALDPSTGLTTAICSDKTGTEVRVPAYTLRAKGAPPQAGEMWLVDQELGYWTLAAYVGPPGAASDLPGPGAGGIASVAAGDASVVVGGTENAPTVKTGPLDEIATLHPPSGPWSNNGQRITDAAPAVAGTDLAVLDQVPLAGLTVSGTPAAGQKLIATGTTAAMWVSEGPLNVVTAFAADNSGGTACDSGVQSAINKAGGLGQGGGAVYFPPGKYLFGNPVVPASGVTIFADNRSGTLITSATCSLFNMGPSSTILNLRMSGLFLSCPGYDIFTGSNIERSTFSDNEFQQKTYNKSFWNNTAGPGLMVECVFERNIESLYGGSSYGGARTVEGWLLVAPNNSNQVNANTWREERCFSNGGDNSMYWYHIQAALSGSGSTPVCYGNKFERVVFEDALGGLINLESCRYCVIDDCNSWDASGTYGNSLFYISKNANGQSPLGNTIRNSGRIPTGSSASFASGVFDIEVDSTASNTIIESPRGTSPAPTLNLGGSAYVTMTGLPSGYSVTGAPASVGDIWGNPMS